MCWCTAFNNIKYIHYWISKASLSGRVRDEAAKQLLAKQLQGLHGNLPEFMNLTTGQIRSKKAKKEKTPAQEAMAEMKKMHKKFLWELLINSVRFIGF